MSKLPLDHIIHGNCIEELERFPKNSIDLIFADPPYNLQLHKTLWRPNQTPVEAVNDDWDQFDDYKAYDEFTRAWLLACKRVLKPTGTLWVIGSYHNIHRVGAILQDLRFWTLNEITWIKTNPMPNFNGVRFANAHETLLWVQKKRGEKYTFNHHAMKSLNGDKQMRSDWVLATCKGKERIRVNGETAHSTQKPESILYRVITSSSDPGDIVLDPFFGTGTTGAVAKRLHRRWIGIEEDLDYVHIAQDRIVQIQPGEFDSMVYQSPNPRRQPRIPFGHLLEVGLIQPGQTLYFKKTGKIKARVLADGALEYNNQRGTIHTLAKKISNAPANGWDFWFFEEDGQKYPIDRLRKFVRQQIAEQKEISNGED